MKLVIAGTRTFIGDDWYLVVLAAIRMSPFERRDIKTVLSGCCPGPDSLGALWAKSTGRGVEHYSPDWSKYGRAAGPIRNTQMAIDADAGIVIWDGKSRGSADMVGKLITQGKPVFEVLINSNTYGIPEGEE